MAEAPHLHPSPLFDFERRDNLCATPSCFSSWRDFSLTHAHTLLPAVWCFELLLLFLEIIPISDVVNATEPPFVAPFVIGQCESILI